MVAPRGSRSPLFLVPTFVLIAAGLGGCHRNSQQPGTQTEMNVAKPPQFNGQDAVVMSRGRSGDGSQPEFLSITLLPGRGMNTLQITAWVPGRGEVSLLASPSLDDAAKILNADPNGNKSFTMGGAFLIPFANRIRGRLTPDKKDIIATWRDQSVELPANWIANTDGVPMSGHEPHAMHGLMLESKANSIDLTRDADGATLITNYDVGNFNGHWFSTNTVRFKAKLTGPDIDLIINVTNTGKKPEPIGIGWHPYFSILSGDRSQVLLHIPAKQTVEVNNHDDVFPTGNLLPVVGTQLDFNAPNGVTLPSKLVDDTFTGLARDMEDQAVMDMRDPAAKYGLRIRAVSPDIDAFQVYAPVNKPFVAIEPQFNLGDPFGKEWKETDTGMKILQPSDTVSWHVQLELFVP